MGIREAHVINMRALFGSFQVDHSLPIGYIRKKLKLSMLKGTFDQLTQQTSPHFSRVAKAIKEYLTYRSIDHIGEIVELFIPGDNVL